MSYLQTVPEENADGEVADLYDGLRGSSGHVPNYGRIFSLRPQLFAAWANLNGTIKSTMDRRRYELATVAAAVARRSSYCSLAHGEILLDLGSVPDQVVSLAGDLSGAGLSDEERAVVDYATKVVTDPVSVDAADIERLRAHGLSDPEILDVAAAAAARCFFTALGDGVGLQADAGYRDRVPELVDGMTVGRPLAAT